MSKEIRIILTSGIPTSGKTTWAKNMESRGWIRVSTDEIRAELFGLKSNVLDFTQNMEVWKVFTETVREKIMESCLIGEKRGVICDCMALSINFIGYIYENTFEILYEKTGILPKMEIKYFNIHPEEARKRIEKAILNNEKRADISLESLYKYKLVQDKLFEEEFSREWLRNRNISEYKC